MLCGGGVCAGWREEGGRGVWWRAVAECFLLLCAALLCACCCAACTYLSAQHTPRSVWIGYRHAHPSPYLASLHEFYDLLVIDLRHIGDLDIHILFGILLHRRVEDRLCVCVV